MMKPTKKKRTIHVGIAAIVIIFAAAWVFIVPAVYENFCRNRVYSDLEEKLDQTIVSANITIMMCEETEEENMTSTDLFC